MSIPTLLLITLVGAVLVLVLKLRGGAGQRDSLEGRSRDLADVPVHMRRGAVDQPLAPPDMRTLPGGSHATPTGSQTIRGLSPEAEAEARLLVASGKKIAAIKIVRQQTGMGLKEAKEFVEAMG